MKHLKLLMIAAVFLLSVTTNQAEAFDKSGYQKIIEDVVKEVISGRFTDIDATLQRLNAAILIGSEGAKERAAAVPSDAGLMQFVVKSAEEIKKTPVDKLEDEWGEGAKAFERAGFKRNAATQFKAAESYADIVVHPATSWAYLSAWKKAPSAALLEQAKGELTEVLEHLKHAN